MKIDHCIQRFWIVYVCLPLLAGCMTMKATPYLPDYKTVDSIKTQRSKMNKISVGTFQPTDPKTSINQISLRGGKMVSPVETFPRYFQEALTEDLKEIGIFDANSPFKLEATLTENDLSVPLLGSGSGSLKATLTLTKNGKSIFQKTYAASISFDSRYLASLAVPIAQSEYVHLVQKMNAQILTDSELLKELSK